MKTALVAPFTPMDMNLEILCLLARELDPQRHDTRYPTPFSVLRKKKGGAVHEADDVFVVGAE